MPKRSKGAPSITRASNFGTLDSFLPPSKMYWKQRWMAAMVSGAAKIGIRACCRKLNGRTSSRPIRWSAWECVNTSRGILGWTHAVGGALPAATWLLRARFADQIGQRLLLQRRREIVALTIVAVQRLQFRELLLPLDAFGHHLHAQVLRQQQDSPDRIAGTVGFGHVDHERPVDLEDVEWKTAQALERGVSGSEVVDLQTHAQGFQAAQQACDGIHIVHQDALGDLQ